ncbi:hypothetical protein M569_05644, partial [Genlisea aurea]
LFYFLQALWNEIGEDEAAKGKMLEEIERQCLDIYKTRIDEAKTYEAQLKHEMAETESELAAIFSAMGEQPVHIRQQHENLKAKLEAIGPHIEEMRRRKVDRENQFLEVLEEIKDVKHDIYGSDDVDSLHHIEFNEAADLSTRKLEELHSELQELRREKIVRMKQVLDHLSNLDSLCSVLGMESKTITNGIHPSLVETNHSKNVTDKTIQQLRLAVESLKDLKSQRMQKLQDLAASLLQLWNSMDTRMEEQEPFHKVTRNIAASEDEITEPNFLSVDYLNLVEGEVSRLEELKASIMMELILKKKEDLEDICQKTHLAVSDEYGSIETSIRDVESGAIEGSHVLEQIEVSIAKAKEDTLIRKDVLERVEKWQMACEEEIWLDEYNKDENRYNTGKGTHLVLKRAEKARALVNKLPAMVEALIGKVAAWEESNRTEFTYDGVHLLSMLNQYMIMRREKEAEQKFQRDRKKLHGHIVAEQEVVVTKQQQPSLVKNQSFKKG